MVLSASSGIAASPQTASRPWKAQLGWTARGWATLKSSGIQGPLTKVVAREKYPAPSRVGGFIRLRYRLK